MEKKTHLYKVHSVKYNYLMNLILTTSSFLFPLITFPYASRILLVEGNGKVNFAASIMNYFLMIANLGIPTYGVRACAKVRDNKEELSRTAQEILIINFVSTTIATISYGACILYVPRFRTDQLLFLIEGITIVLNMLGANWLYQALEQYDYITFRSILFKTFSVMLMFLLVHQENDYELYALTTIVGSVGSNALNFYRLHKLIYWKRFERYNLKRHLKPILILFAQVAAVSIYTNLDTVMLGFLKGDFEVGLYSSAVKIKSVLLGLVSSLGSVLLPRMSFYVKKKNYEEFNRLSVLALNAQLLVALPLAIYFTVEAKDCIVFLAGNKFSEASSAMMMINISIIPIAITNIIGIQMLTPLDREKQVLNSVLVGAGIDFLLNLLFINRWGATGAALATTIAEVAVLIYQIIIGKDILYYILPNVDFSKYIVTSLSSGISFMILPMLINQNVFIKLVISSILYFGLYLAQLMLLKDKIIIQIVGSILKR